MKKILYVLVLHCLLSTGTNAQQLPFENLENDNSKAARYYQALVKRPDSDTLFSRFFETWLDTYSIADLETFLMKNPNPGAGDYFIRGRFLIRQGKDQQSRDALQQVVNHADASPSQKSSALITLSEIAIRDLDFREALDRINYAEYQHSLVESKDPEQTIKIAKLKGKTLIRIDQPDKALKVWQNLFDKYPDDRHLQEDVIKLLTEEGLYTEAIQEQTQIIERLQKSNIYESVVAKIELGQIYRRSNNAKKAVETWSNAIPATGQNTWIEKEILSLIDSSFRQKEDLLGLRQTLTKLIESEPQRLSLHRALARLFTDTQDHKAALAKWQEILKLTPGQVEIRLEYIDTLTRLNRPQQAADQLVEIIRLNPDDVELWIQLSSLYFKADRKQDSINSLTTFLEKSDGTPLDYLRVCQQMIRYGFLDQANQTFSQLIEQHPQDANARQAYAGFLFDKYDDRAKAILLWREIASTGDLNQVIRTSKDLQRRSEQQLSYDLLTNRATDFDKEPTFVREIAAAALELKLEDQAFNWALRGVNLSNDAKDFIANSEWVVNTAARITNGYEAAIATIKNRESINSQCLIALLQSANSEPDLAIKSMRELVLKTQTNQVDYPLLTLSVIYQKQRSWTAAAEIMEQLLENSPSGNHSSYIQELVILYDRAQRPVEALDSIRKWKQLSPGNFSAWIKEAEFLERAGQVRDALRVIQTAARKFEQNATVQSKLADIYSDTGYHLEAERILWRLYDENTDPWKRQGWVARLVGVVKQSGREDSLIAEFKRRKNARTQSIDPIFSLAEAYRLIGKKQEYREQLLSASALEPDNIHLIHKVADLDVAEGRFHDAQQALTRIVEQDKTGRTVNRIARLYVVTGQIDKALGLMSSLPNGKKPTLQEVIGLAETSLSLGEWQVAATFLKNQIADFPDQIDIGYLHAVCQLEAGNIEQAKAAYLSLLNYRFNNAATTPIGIDQMEQVYQNAFDYRSGMNPTEGLHTPIYYINTNHYTRSIIPIPQTEAVLRAHVVAHLSGIKQFNLQDQSETLVSAGLPKKELAIAQYYLTKRGTPEQLFQQFPNDPEIAAWYLNKVYQNQLNNKKPKAAEQISAVIDLIYQQQGAEPALEFALQFEAADQIERYFQEINNLNDNLIRLFFSKWEQLDKSIQNDLLKMLENWESSEHPQQGWIALNSTLTHFYNQGMTKQWLMVVKREWLSQLPKKTELPLNYSSFLIRTQNKGPIAWYNPGIPVVIQNLLINQTEFNIPEDLESHLDLVTDTPTLHQTLASRIKSELHFKQSIVNLKARVKSGNATLSELFFLAHWYANTDLKNRDLNTASDLYLQVRNLSTQAEIQTVIDLQITHLARDSQINTDLRNRGVDAAKRLRLDANLPAQLWKDSIVPLFNKWGMQGKTKRPTRVTTAALAIQQSLYYGYTPTNKTSTQAPSIKLPSIDIVRSQIDQLLDNNQTETAIRILKQQLPIQAGRILTADSEYEKGNFEYLFELLDKNNLVNQVLDAAKPPSNARHLDRARFAALCEALRATDRAEKLYRDLLKENPDNSMIRLRLIHNLAEESPTKALEELGKLVSNKEQILKDPFILAALDSITSVYPHEAIEIITLSEAVLDFLKDAKPLERKPEQSVSRNTPYYTQSGVIQLNHLLRYLSNSYYKNGQRLPNLFSEEKTPDSLKEIDTRRTKAFGELCKRFVELRLNNNEANYFNGALKAHQALGKPDAELLPWTKRVIENYLSTNLSDNWFSQENQNQAIPWYIETAHTLKRPELVAELKASAKASENLANLVAIQNCEQFFICKPENFNRTIRNAIGLPVAESPVPAPKAIPAWGLINRAIEVRPEIRKFFDAEEIALAYLNANPNDNDAKQLCYNVARQAASTPEKLVTYLDRISKQLFPDGIEKGLIDEFKLSQSPSNSATFFIELVNEMVNNPKASYSTILYAKKQGLGKLAQFNQLPKAFLSQDQEIEPTAFMDLIKSTAFNHSLQDFETFNKLDFPYLKTDYQSVFADWVISLKTAFIDSDDDSNRPELHNQIREITSGSFARELAVAALSESPDMALIELFNQKRSEIEKLTAERKHEIIQLATEVIEFQSLGRNLSKSERQTLQWLSQHSVKLPNKEQIEVFAKAASFSEMGGRIAGNQLELQYIPMIANELSWNWQRAFAAFENICALGEDAVATGALAPAEYTFTRNTFDAVINRNMPIESFAFTLAVFNSDKLDPLLEINHITDSIVIEFKHTKNQNDGKHPIQVISEFFEGIQQQYNLSELDTRVSVPIFYQLFKSLSRLDRPALTKWVWDEDCMKKFPILAKHAQAALFIAKRSDPMNAEMLNYFSQLLSSTSEKDYGVRLMISALICDELYTVPESIIHQSIDALIKAWQSDAIVPPNYASDILEKYEQLAQQQERQDLTPFETALGDLFHRKFLANERLSRYPRSQKNLAVNRSLLKTILGIQTKNKQLASANVILKKYQEFLEPEAPNILSILIKNGAYEMAATQIRTNWSAILEKSPYQYRFNSSYGNALLNFLAEVKGEQPWLPVLAEISQATMRDPRGIEPDKTWGDQNNRVIAAAKKLGSTQFPETEMRAKAVSLLKRYPASKIVIENMTLQSAKQITISALAKEKNPEKRRKQITALTDQLAIHLLKNDLRPWKKTLTDTLKVNNKRLRNQIFAALFKQLDDSRKNKSLTPSQATTLLNLYQWMLTKIHAYSFNIVELSHYIALTYQAGKESEFREWLQKSQSITFRKFGTNSLEGGPLFVEAARLINDGRIKDKILNDALGTNVETDLNQMELNQIQGPMKIIDLCINRFLKDKSLSNAWFQADKLAPSVAEMLIHCESNHQLQRKVFSHACKLHGPAPITVKNTAINQETIAFQIATTYNTRTNKTNDWTTLSNLLDLAIHTPASNPVFMWYGSFGETYRLSQMLAESFHVWNFESALRQQLETLHLDLEELNLQNLSDCLTPLFYRYYMGLDQTLYPKMLHKNAKKVAKQTQYPVAHALVLAGDLYMRKHSPSDSTTELNDASINRIVNLLKNQTIPLRKRLSMARFFCLKSTAGENYKPVRIESAKVLASALNKPNQFVPSSDLFNIVYQFNFLDRDANWNKIAAEIEKGWWSKIPAPKAKNGFEPSIQALSAMLHLFAKLDNKGSMSRLMKRYPGRLEERSLVLGILVREKQFETAKRLLNTKLLTWDTTRLNYTDLYPIRYDKALENEMPKFLKILGQERPFGELYLASLYNQSNNYSKTAKNSRTDRLSNLAKGYKKLSFPSPKHRSKYLYNLSRESFLISYVHDELKQSFQTRLQQVKPILHKKKSSYAQSEDVILPLANYAAYEACQGNLKPFRELMNTISSLNVWIRNSHDHLFFQLNRQMSDLFFTMTPSQQRSAFDAYSEILNNYTYLTAYNNPTQAAVTHIILGSLLEDDEAMDRWRGSYLPRKSRIKNYIKQKKFMIGLTPLILIKSTTDNKQKQKQVTKLAMGLFSDEWVQAAAPIHSFSGSQVILAKLLYYNLIDANWLRTNANQLLESAFKKNDLALAIGIYFTSIDDLPNAEIYMDIAATGTTELKLQSAKWFLDFNNKPAKAKQILSSIEVSSIKSTDWLEWFQLNQ